MRSSIRIFAFYGVVISLASTLVNAKTELWGAIGAEDLFLRREHINANAIIRNTTEMFYEYPRLWDDNEFPLTAVKVIDKLPQQTTAVTIVKGGVGETFLKLHFKSTLNHGIRAVIELYGKDHTP